MEQLNIPSPAYQEENKLATVTVYKREEESQLLKKVRSNFGIFGGISLVFGIAYTSFFYKAGVGLNVFIFTLVMIILLYAVMKKLSLSLKTGTIIYYTGAALLGLSTALTSSWILQTLNVLGILFLLDLSLLHQFYEDHRWDFTKHFCRMFGLFFQSIAAIGKPLSDSVRFFKSRKIFKNEKTSNILIGLIVSLPFLLLILALLSNADLLFGKLTQGVFDTIFSSEILFIGFMVLFGFLACYCIICAAVVKAGAEEKRERARADASIAATVMTVLCVVYALFCVIQLVYLFSNGVMVLPEEFTFAEYARRGFFELLAVTIINIVLILLCRAFFQESSFLRFIVTCMTVCTYIMIASATYRMLLYIGAYHLTFLRVFVLLSLLIDALVLAGVIVSEYNKRFPLFRYCVAVIAVCYIIFSFSRPDHYIAEYLIKQNQLLDREDMLYLTRDLSLDAADVVLPLLADEDHWTMVELTDQDDYGSNRFLYGTSEADIKAEYYARINAKDQKDIREFVYSNYQATKLVKKYPQQ